MDYIRANVTTLLPLIAITASFALYSARLLVTNRRVLWEHRRKAALFLGVLWTGFALSVVQSDLAAEGIRRWSVESVIGLVCLASLFLLANEIWTDARTVTGYDVELFYHWARVLMVHIASSAIATTLYFFCDCGNSDWWKFGFLLLSPYFVAGVIAMIYGLRQTQDDSV